MICPNCGADVAQGKKFCTKCATPLLCKECGSELSLGKKFCADCGTPVQGVAAPTVATEVPQAPSPSPIVAAPEPPPPQIAQQPYAPIPPIPPIATIPEPRTPAMPPKKSKKGGVIAAVAAVLVLGCVAGGHFMNLYTLPFLPERAPMEDSNNPETIQNNDNDDKNNNDTNEPDAEINNQPPDAGQDIVSDRRLAYLISLLNEHVLGEPGFDFITVEEHPDYFIVRLESDVLFSPGSASISPEMISYLNRFSPHIMHADAFYSIEGHTDDLPISTPQFPSNWHLSQARAIAVGELLFPHEYNTETVVMVGQGGHIPIDTSGTPEARARNRRIEIIIFMADLPQGQTQQPSQTQPPTQVQPPAQTPPPVQALTPSEIWGTWDTGVLDNGLRMIYTFDINMSFTSLIYVEHSDFLEETIGTYSISGNTVLFEGVSTQWFEGDLEEWDTEYTLEISLSGTTMSVLAYDGTIYTFKRT